MSIYLEHKEFFNKPIRLSPDIKPFEFLKDWFNAVHLNEARDSLDQLIETALVCDNYHFNEPQRRDSILFFARRLEECLEAAWLLTRKAEPVATARETVSQFGEGTDEEMAELIWYIVRMTAPERIFLLQGKGRNAGENLVHLLITVPGNNRRNFPELQTIIELCRLKTTTVYVSIYHTAQWREYVERRYLFYCSISKSEYLVYEATGVTPLPIATAEAMEVAIRKAKEYFLTGHSKALALMQLGNQLQQEQNRALSVFMYQQSAELCLRSLIFAVTGMECRTHSITVLNKHMSRYAPELCTYFAGGNDFEDGLMRLLDQSYTEGRYNSEFKVPDQYLEVIRERIPKLLNATLGAFEELLKRVETWSEAFDNNLKA